MASEEPYETLKHTAEGFIKAYGEPRAWDPNEVWQYCTADKVHYLHPKQSLPPGFNGVLHKDEFFQSLQFFGGVMDYTRIEIDEMAIDVKKRIVSLRLTDVFDVKPVGGADAVKGFAAEYMCLLEMEETGKKISRVEEYIDVGRLMGFVKPKAEQYAESTK